MCVKVWETPQSVETAWVCSNEPNRQGIWGNAGVALVLSALLCCAMSCFALPADNWRELLNAAYAPEEFNESGYQAQPRINMMLASAHNVTHIHLYCYVNMIGLLLLSK